MQGVIAQSFASNLSIMRVLGLYDSDKTRLKKYLAYASYFFSIVPMPLFGILYLFFEENIAMDRVYDNAFLLADMTCYITKLLPFIKNSVKIKQCIEFFDNNSLFAISNPDVTKITTECIQVCRRNSKAFFVVVIGGICVWVLKPFFWTHYHLPVDVWLPLTLTPGSILNICVYLFLVAGALYASFANAAIDPLIGGLACQAATQFKILKYGLKHLDGITEQEVPFRSHKINVDTVYTNIRKCIYHHKAILRFSKEFEDCFSWVVFSQFVGSVFVICLCCLQLSQSDPLTFNFFIMASYLIICLVQVYFYCYYGTTLFEESNDLTNAVYMGKWYQLDVKAQKSLSILMERSNKPIVITAGKILNLSLETFTMIIRRSYSLLAVLQTY